MKDMSVRALSLHRPVILQKKDSLKQAALAMKRNQIGSVLVADGKGELRGIFTDRDLAMALALDNMPTTVPLSEATRHNLLYVSESATLRDVVNLMKKHGIRRVPVVRERSNGRQKCLGVITLDDLIKEHLIDSNEEALILRSQLKVPKEKIGRGRLKSIFHAQDHREQSLHDFIKTVEIRTELNRSKSRLLTQEVLALIVRRIPAKAGKNLLSQLPYELQMQLLFEVNDSDRAIDGKLLLQHVQKRFSLKSDEAQVLLANFWESLAETISPGELRNVERSLPRDLNLLFNPASKGGRLV